MREIETLLERSERALASATLLLKEKDFDSSVSRSYYAMFYATEALLLTRKVKFSSHRSVISLFGEHFVKSGTFKPEMGKRLSKTFEKRLVGDYSFAPELSEEEASEALNGAKEFVAAVKEHLLGEGHLGHHRS